MVCGRSLWEQRDQPRLCSVRRHRRSAAAERQRARGVQWLRTGTDTAPSTSTQRTFRVSPRAAELVCPDLASGLTEGGRGCGEPNAGRAGGGRILKFSCINTKEIKP